MAKKENSEEVFTHRVRPDGDGRYFVGAKYNEAGEEVEVVTQRHMSEPDAEKELRSIVSGNDVIATPRLHSVDAEDNTHVILETSAPEEAKRKGATISYAPAEGEAAEKTPADVALEEGKVSTVASNDEPTEAEQKARDRSAAAAKKHDEKAQKEGE